MGYLGARMASLLLALKPHNSTNNGMRKISLEGANWVCVEAQLIGNTVEPLIKGLPQIGQTSL